MTRFIFLFPFLYFLVSPSHGNVINKIDVKSSDVNKFDVEAAVKTLQNDVIGLKKNIQEEKDDVKELKKQVFCNCWGPSINAIQRNTIQLNSVTVKL